MMVGKDVNGGPRKAVRRRHLDRAYLADLIAGGSTSAWPTSNAVDRRIAEQKRHQFDLAFEEKRKKLTQGDELPPGRAEDDQGLPGRPSAACSGTTRWPAVTATRAWFRALRRSRTCPTCATALPPTSFEPLGVPSRMNVSRINPNPGWAGPPGRGLPHRRHAARRAHG